MLADFAVDKAASTLGEDLAPGLTDRGARPRLPAAGLRSSGLGQARGGEGLALAAPGGVEIGASAPPPPLELCGGGGALAPGLPPTGPDGATAPGQKINGYARMPRMDPGALRKAYINRLLCQISLSFILTNAPSAPSRLR